MNANINKLQTILNADNFGSNTRVVSSRGSDSNSGLSVRQSMLTLRAAIASLTNGRGLIQLETKTKYTETGGSAGDKQPGLAIPQAIHLAPLGGPGRFGDLGGNAFSPIKDSVCIEWGGANRSGKEEPCFGFGWSTLNDWPTDASSGGGSIHGIFFRLGSGVSADYLFEDIQPQNNTFIGHCRFGMSHGTANANSGSAAISQFFIRGAGPNTSVGAAQYDNLRIQGGKFPARIAAAGTDGILFNNLCMDCDDATTSAILVEAQEANMATVAPAISGITWAGGVATVTTTAPHGLTTGSKFPLVVTASNPAGYNTVSGGAELTISGASTYTYNVTSNPGAYVGSAVGTIYSTTWVTNGPNAGDNGSAPVLINGGQIEIPNASGGGALNANGIQIDDDAAVVLQGFPIWAGSNHSTTGHAIYYTTTLTGTKLPRVWTQGVHVMGFADAWNAPNLAKPGDLAVIPSVQGAWRDFPNMEPRLWRRVVTGAGRTKGADTDWPSGYVTDGFMGGHIVRNTTNSNEYWTWRDNGAWWSVLGS